MQQWQSFSLVGVPAVDTITVARIIQKLPTLYNAPDSTHGVKIIFNKESKYKEFIHLLNKVNEVGIRRYAFEVRTPEPIFYIFEDKVYIPSQHLLSPK